MSFGKFLVLASLFSVHSLAAEIKVPSYLTGVLDDVKAKKGEFYIYNIDGKFDPQPITAKKTSNESVEDLVSSMVYSYENNDQQFFLSLFSKEAAAQIKSMPKPDFEMMWKVNSNQKNIKLQFYHEMNKGMLIGLKSSTDKNLQIHYARKINKSWSFDKLLMNDNDPKTNNVGLWISFLPMKMSKASLVKTFTRKDKFNILEAQVTEPYLSIFYKAKNRWEVLGQTKDNDDKYSSWPDLNKSQGLVRIDLENLSPSNPEKTEILVMESSFPVSFLPFSVESTGQFTY